MPDILQQMRQLSLAVHPLSDESWETFAGLWEPLTVRRKELLTRAGEKERYLYFVFDGVQRVYF